MKYSTISFPGLGIGEFTVDNVAFEIFGVTIAWYALIITCGMIAAVVYAALMAKKIGIILDDVIDYALWTIPLGVIGARLYYVLTTLDEVGYDSFFDVINIRGGGLAIYGGIIAGGLTVLAVSYFKKINFLAFADCVAPGVLLAQGIGRWGNFMNGEAFGGITTWFCRMGLQNTNTFHTFGTHELVYVHPTFLYESLWNFLGFALVNLYAKFFHKKYDGQLFIMIFGWYGLGRMLIEGLRTDSLYIPGTDLRVSQVLAAVIFVICTVLLIYFAIKRPTKPLYHKPEKVPVNGKAAKDSENNLWKKFTESKPVTFIKEQWKKLFSKDDGNSKNNKNNKKGKK